MKKLLAITMTLVMALALTACAAQDEADENVTPDVDTSVEGDVDTDADVDGEEETEDDTDAEVEEDADADTATDVTMESPLADIMNQVIATVEVDDEVREYVLGALGQTEVTEEMEEMFLGTTEFEYEEAYAAEPMVNAQALSLVLVRTATEDEAVTLAEEIVTTVNPNKWVCVGVDPSDVKAVAVGNTVFLVMADNSEAYITAFEAISV